MQHNLPYFPIFPCKTNFDQNSDPLQNKSIPVVNTKLHCTKQRRIENVQVSTSRNDVYCKPVKEELADPEMHEICHVTKFFQIGNLKAWRHLLRERCIQAYLDALRRHHRLSHWKATQVSSPSLILPSVAAHFN